ncbi:hypothetical protein [Bacillus mycoides]|uniref:hypothetical protein n=1 Tax=Bacillus mycoides TaxID=1405 RepID=UPI001F130224|nr:hypothetical protein [Bacillus mycoides]
MGNNSKYKTRKILAATATVTMLTTGMVSSSDVFAEETKQQKKYRHHCKRKIQLNQKTEYIQSQEKGMLRY